LCPQRFGKGFEFRKFLFVRTYVGVHRKTYCNFIDNLKVSVI
jgi:hypothetical protein